MKRPVAAPMFAAATVVAAAIMSVPAPLYAESGDSKPVVISTGKGNSWANMAELKKAAEAHNPKACSEYGDALVKGDEVKQDVAKGLAFLQEAASAGEANAFFRLGKIYDDGEFAPRDYEKAFECYAAAAKNGVVEAQYDLGVLYATGRGTKRDYVEGLAWLIVATKNGAPGDGERKTREQLQKTKRAREIAAAEQRAMEIQKNPAKAAVDAKPAGEPVPAKAMVAPEKVDLGGPTVKATPAAPTLPGFGPGSGGGLAPTPPLNPEPPPAPQAGGSDTKSKS